MKLTAVHDDRAAATRYTLTITDAERRAAQLTAVDRALLRECEGPDATIADRLLGLECVAQRVEQTRGQSEGESEDDRWGPS